jgi:hypothetical protein
VRNRDRGISIGRACRAGDRGKSEEDVEGKQSIGEDRVRIELLKMKEIRVRL